VQLRRCVSELEFNFSELQFTIRQLCDFRLPLKLLKSRDTEDFSIWQTPCLTGMQRVGTLETRMDRNQKRSQPKGFSNEP
jgi:hypothetical protein